MYYTANLISMGLFTVPFYDRTLRKRSISDSYLKFDELSVVVLSDDTHSTSSDGTTSLNIHFYVILPTEGNRSPNRQTNYVVPGATLNLLTREDRQTIEAVVRDSVAQQQALVQGVQDWILGTLAVCGVVGSVIFAVFVILACKAVKKHLRRYCKIMVTLCMGYNMIHVHCIGVDSSLLYVYYS